jgi:hypothetical protein
MIALDSNPAPDSADHGSCAVAVCSRHVRSLSASIAKLKEELDWQNMPNRREPFRGGWEFYINEEWTGIRDAAMGEDVGCVATLMKVRFDPDDERVRVRRVLDDDAILQDLAEARKALDSSANESTLPTEGAAKNL